MGIQSNIQRHIQHIQKIVGEKSAVSPVVILKTLLEKQYLHESSKSKFIHSYFKNHHEQFALQLITILNKTEKNDPTIRPQEFLYKIDEYLLKCDLQHININRDGNFYTILCAFFYYYQSLLTTELQLCGHIKDFILSCVDSFRRIDEDEMFNKLIIDSCSSEAHVSFSAYQTLTKLNYIPERKMLEILNVFVIGSVSASDEIAGPSLLALAKHVKFLTSDQKKSLITNLLKQLKFDREITRASSFLALTEIKHFTEDQYVELLNQLKSLTLLLDSKPKIAIKAYRLLGNLSSLPVKLKQEVVSFLEQQQKSSVPLVVLDSKMTLARLHYYSSEKSRELIDQWKLDLTSEKKARRLSACRMLQAIPVMADDQLLPVMEALIATTKDKNIHIQIAALDSIGANIMRLKRHDADTILDRLLVPATHNTEAPDIYSWYKHLCQTLGKYENASKKMQGKIIDFLLQKQEQTSLLPIIHEVFGNMKKIPLSKMNEVWRALLHNAQDRFSNTREKSFQALLKMMRLLSEDKLVYLEISAKEFFSPKYEPDFYHRFYAALRSEILQRPTKEASVSFRMTPQHAVNN